MTIDTDIAAQANTPRQSVLPAALAATFADKQTSWARRERWRS